MKPEVAVLKCRNYEPALVQEAVGKAIDLLGGISVFIKPGSRVLVKPNLLLAKEPEYGITTHPEVVRAVVKVLKKINCSIFVGDGPSVWGNQAEMVDQVYDLTGTKRICLEENVELVRFEKNRWRKKFPLTSWLDDCDYLVSVPKFKTHELTTLTGGVKNLFGLVSYAFKKELHKNYFELEDFASIIVDIYEETRPALTVIDGIVAMEGDGPASSGRLCERNLILAGSDCVAIDSILALVMGLKPQEILTNKEAARRGLGEADVNSINILGERLKDIVDKPFKLPATSLITKIPKSAVDLAKKYIRLYPGVRHSNCIRCGSCVNACPQKIISMKNNRVTIAYASCISCFCCQEACPADAIKAEKSILARILGFLASKFLA